jgi:hypothetical protein
VEEKAMSMPFGDQPKIGPFAGLGSPCGTSLRVAPLWGETSSRDNPLREAGPPVQAIHFAEGDHTGSL